VYSPNKTIFSVIRYGNFINSSGSVVQYFEQLKEAGIKALPITDFRMTRFFISLDEAVDKGLKALEIMKGGEIFNPKMTSMKITDLAHSIYPEARLIEVGSRPGEKLFEELILPYDTNRTYEQDEFYITYPNGDGKGKKVRPDFYYSSKVVSSTGL
jgi:FlaA1/EpsC-like NDP-sugar epimerase